MVKRLLLLLLLLLLASGCLFAEEKPVVRALLTLTPGLLTAQKVSTYGIGGELEIYTGGKISLRGDAYALAGKSESGGLKQNYQGFFGLVYNFDKVLSLSPFAGFQPGFGLGQVESMATDALSLYPALSPVTGFHYFAETLFHFTVNIRYVFGEMHYRDTGAVYLSELRAAFGLGIFF